MWDWRTLDTNTMSLYGDFLMYAAGAAAEFFQGGGGVDKMEREMGWKFNKRERERGVLSVYSQRSIYAVTIFILLIFFISYWDFFHDKATFTWQ